MGHLPYDILIAIATQLRCEHRATAYLLAFIKVCSTWYALGLPLLYGNIGLGTHSLEPFAHTFVPAKYGRFVRSLSLHMDAATTLVDPGSSEQMFDHRFPDDTHRVNLQSPVIAHLQDSRCLTTNGYETRSLPSSLAFAQFIPILRSLQNLASFSLTIEVGASWCSLPRDTIVGLIDALPVACTHLELDTNAHDEQFGSQTHVCEYIRQVLPRMRTVRLRLGAMCSALFEPGLHSSLSAELHTDAAILPPNDPIHLSNIRSLVVNCGIAANGELLPQCGYEGARQWEICAEAWCAITSSLTQLVSQQAKSLKAAEILVLSPTWGLSTDLSLDTQLRTDMVNKTTWALPCVPQCQQSSLSGCFLVRCPDGSEKAIRNLESVDDIAEGVWKDVVGGGRLPAEILDAEERGLPCFATGCIERPITNLMKQWLELHSGIPKSRTFCNEKKTGMRLALAEKRTGHHFLALRPVKEITPDGWIRTGSALELEPA